MIKFSVLFLFNAFFYLILLINELKNKDKNLKKIFNIYLKNIKRHL